jgi:platelet-activating factor acetylhydrolase IB subunit alpha
MELQNELESMKSEMAYFGPGKKLTDGAALEGLPRIPEKFTLTGHRDTITCVIFHPVYSVVASSSEDGSIRLWDYESG